MWGGSGDSYDRVQDSRIIDVANRVLHIEAVQKQDASQQSTMQQEEVCAGPGREGLGMQRAAEGWWLHCACTEFGTALAGAGMAGGRSCLCQVRRDASWQYAPAHTALAH